MSFDLNSLLGGKSLTKALPSAPKIGFDNDKDIFADGKPYDIIENNWYTARPYGFKVTMRDNRDFTMFLPINPNNLRISTGFATNMVSTLYGTVEEHSPVRYYDIMISGNTGMAPKFTKIEQKNTSSGRASFSVSQGLSNIAGGFFVKTLSLADKILNSASELINGVPKPQTGVFADQTGYLAFHNLYRMLLKHKEDAAGISNSTATRTQHPLTFFNYKDNNEYDVVVRKFDLIKSVDNPMVYNYEIILRGYNMRTAGSNQSIDQSDLTHRLEALGLNGVDSSSLLSKIKSTANRVKGILGPLGAGINILGR
jgi:hypothetical protein